MSALTFLLVGAAVGLALARRLGVPAIPVLIVVGVVGSALVPLPVDLMENALLLGLTVMVFVAGIELNPRRVRGQRAAVIQVGLVQFFVLGGIGLLASLFLGYSLESAAYVALALTASSTLVGVQLLRSRQQFFEPFGRLVTGVLLLQDLLVILAIPVLTRLSDGVAAIGMGVVSTLALVALAWLVTRWIAPLMVRRLGSDDEVLLLAVLAILFSFLGLAQLFQLPLVSGAFLAGLALSGFPVNALVRGTLSSLSDFFNALFFTALGAFLPIPLGMELFDALFLALIVIVVTPPLVAVVAERAGFSARPALAAGLLISQTSEFSLVVGLQGVVLGQIAPETFGTIATVTVLTMVATPFLATDRMTWTLMRLHPFRDRIRLEEPPEGHVLLLGGGRNGIALLELLVVTPNRIVVVDDDPALVHQVQDALIPVLRGDVSDVSVLKAAGAPRARAIISTIRRKEDTAPLLGLVHDIPVLIRAFNVEDAEWIRRRGGRPILYSEAAAQDFLAWYRKDGPGTASEVPTEAEPNPPIGT